MVGVRSLCHVDKTIRHTNEKARLASSPDDGCDYANSQSADSMGGCLTPSTITSPTLSPASPGSYLSSLSYCSGTVGIENEDSMARRSSFGGPMSPEVESPRTGDQEGFYLLKKDSQRRITLTRVLNDDQEAIIEIWYQRFSQDLASSRLFITPNHMKVLLIALRRFIPEQSKKVIEEAINSLRSQLTFDESSINQISLALYSLQFAVNEVLKKHNIKPHWMFALDDLVRKAVHVAISVLSPEQEALLAQGGGVGREVLEDGSTSGVSTNSGKSVKGMQVSKHCSQLQENIQATKHISLKLCEELFIAEKRYCDLLHLILNERTGLIDQLEQKISNDSSYLDRCGGREGKKSYRTNQQSSSNSNTATPSTLSAERENVITACVVEEAIARTSFPICQTASFPIDVELVEWLQSKGIDSEVIDKFLEEQYNKDDVLTWMSREDLRKLKLRGGVELRIWRLIVEYRMQAGLLLNPENITATEGTSQPNIDLPKQF